MADRGASRLAALRRRVSKLRSDDSPQGVDARTRGEDRSAVDARRVAVDDEAAASAGEGRFEGVPTADGSGGLSMGGLAHSDLSGIGTDDHHAKDHDHTEADISTIPNAGLTNSSIELIGGNGLGWGGVASLGGAFNLDVEPADLDGWFLDPDGNGNLEVDIGAGLEADANDSLQVALGNELQFDGYDQIEVMENGIDAAELKTPFADLTTLFGSRVDAGGTLDMDYNLITQASDIQSQKLNGADTSSSAPADQVLTTNGNGDLQHENAVVGATANYEIQKDGTDGAGIINFKTA